MDNVLAITFADDQNAFAGLTALKELDDQGQLGLTGAAVVIRNLDGSIEIKDEVGDVGYAGTATGGIVGLLIGILGGPLGVLIGGATGVLIGSLFVLDDIDDSESVLSEMSHSVLIDRNSVLAEVSEQSPEVVDSAMERLGGSVVRRDVYDVEAEIAAAEEAQRAAKKEARRLLHEKRREARREKVQAKIAELKAKLHLGHPSEASNS
jgi:uncharacterized membrane protein